MIFAHASCCGPADPHHLYCMSHCYQRASLVPAAAAAAVGGLLTCPSLHRGVLVALDQPAACSCPPSAALGSSQQVCPTVCPTVCLFLLVDPDALRILYWT